MKKRIYYDSTDAGGIVYHTEYIKFCEQARSEIFFQNNIFFENDGYVVTDLKAKYISSAKLGDIIEIQTKILNYTKIRINILQEIYKENKKIFVLEVNVAYIKNGKIAKIPQEHIKIFNEYT
ncbi:thioesterase family protein [Nautilia profundicola AmH]|uniref:Thioesterase family protein n=1 Tax=Nautilia profundicola (strain ATCC BAA-1463 / DSM 18972 / AmH) TaxID=598659 RepID=B9L7S6_NAUPA|nr:thioesterase family protein [Nautilia profundicola]ACM92266.1 thioesterase family protein [Nautilia profundicola AmH]